ncbi:uncharacterized protein PGTG_05845 [Puccinia graminis f. sp. tritici CRL 75-36-700-3]|uniref:DDE Tnp4 domain-containing protein n=1 Tax=Puccinia graminis f. sp. tritici (strain CRL 75-36-700-3 / race SCCL) TaxID=418459 RepID=E3K5V3_PUCGT|nr:uncharacterized protein PGTG_05845 [Puccinia graminis f. sp. tritici CRL 75-36-700-3]EFP79524.2 hypothetical protein PGTG_05845 [Puccinia graminis f. sp. tritici CRL 75-36-700-3]
MLVFLHQQETDDLLDSTINIPVLHSLGRIAAPNNPGRALLLDVKFGDESMVSDLLQVVLSSRYLHTRLPPRMRDEFDLAQLFDMRDEDFKQAVRTTKAGFTWLLSQVNLNPIFHSNSFRPQLPIPHQLAPTLKRLGSNGNGASVGQFSRNLGVGRGTVVKASRRVIRAINNLSEKYLTWPDKVRRKEISDVMKCEGFKGCVGFVDGTTIPLYQRPSIDGEVFFDRKKRYLEMVEGYPLRIPVIRWQIPANGCGWPLFHKTLAGIRVSQRIPAAGRGDGRLEGHPSGRRGTSTSLTGRKPFRSTRYKYLVNWKETLPAIKVQVPCQLEGDPSSRPFRGRVSKDTRSDTRCGRRIPASGCGCSDGRKKQPDICICVDIRMPIDHL